MSTTAAPFPLIQEPAEEYHAKAKQHLSSHQLGNFRRCPALYRKKQLGLVGDEDRPASGPTAWPSIFFRKESPKAWCGRSIAECTVRSVSIGSTRIAASWI